MHFGAHPITLRQLQYVVAVADLRHFGQAAARCFVSQPALSAQVKAVEQALELTLFERTGRRVLLTTHGEAFAAQARRALLAFEEVLTTAQRHRDPLQGVLRIGVIPTLAPYALPRIAPALRARWPALRVRWLEEKTSTLVSLLEQGELDAALLAEASDLGRLATTAVHYDPFVLAAAPTHPLGQTTAAAQLQDLSAHPVLLLDDGHCFADQAIELCSSTGAETASFRATSLATLTQIVANGDVVTLLPELALPVENRTGQLVVRRFEAPAPGRTVVLGWRQGTPFVDALQSLAAAMHDALSDTPQR